ncbi:MAG TPA: iron ABC transporter permease [Microbacteriaceae bacterium]|nr:iron ABC transporter permease [Microbacteriaceae bacterium]
MLTDVPSSGKASDVDRWAAGPGPVVAGLRDALGGHASHLSGDAAVVFTRVPRTAVGLVVGVALGLAGTVMQGVTRNPLADPGILGVNGGAAFGVVLALYAFGVNGISGYLWFALAGAAAASVLVYAIGSLGASGATPLKLTLAGAALSAGLGSLVNAYLIISQQTFDSFRFWQVGALAGRNWGVIAPVLPILLAGAALALATGPTLNGLALGDDAARSLGQRVGWSRAVSALGVTLLCGGATALAGPIAFVGLVVPHAVRAVTGPDYRWILPGAALAAPSLVLIADVVGRVILPPGEVPAGIVTALIGGPVFIWLVRRGKKAAL